MYQDEYKRWAAADLVDFDLNKELNDIAGDDEAIKDRFAVALEFGTAGLRGVRQMTSTCASTRSSCRYRP